MIDVGQRRHWLVLGLVAGRIASAALAAALWWINLGGVFKGLMNGLVHLFGPHAGMDDPLARLLAAVLIAAVTYIATVIVWRIAEGYVARRFFRTAERLRGDGQQDPHEPASPDPVETMSATIGSTVRG